MDLSGKAEYEAERVVIWQAEGEVKDAVKRGRDGRKGLQRSKVQ